MAEVMVVVGLRSIMLLPCRAAADAAMRYRARRAARHRGLTPSTIVRHCHADCWSGGHRSRLLFGPGAAGRRSLGGEMTEQSIDLRRTGRIGLPAIFAAFFRLGATSFGGGTAGWLYREIVERRHWIDDKDFLAAAPLAIVLALAVGYTKTSQISVVHAVFDGVAAAAIGLTFATGIKLVQFRAASAGPLAVTFMTVLCVGVLRWPMIPVVLCLAPISIGLAFLKRHRHHA